jgi:hypothetical protein
MAKQLILKGCEFGPRWLETLELIAGTRCGRGTTKLFFATFVSPARLPRIRRFPPHLSKKEDYWVGAFRPEIEGRATEFPFGIFKSGRDTWTAFSISESVRTEGLLLKLLGSLSPDFSPALLSSQDIRTMFESLESSDQGEILVNKAVAYSYRGEGEISFQKKPYHAVFNRAEDEAMFIDKVEFTLRAPHLLHAFIARRGVTKYIAGDIRIFLDRVLSFVSQTASAKHELFRNSARRPGEESVYQVEICFRQPVFQDRNDNLAFLGALDLLSRSGMAVLHENPYVHASVIDFMDGSAFDVFATAPSAVTIIPQVKASAFSLNRLCNHIFENFHEGIITQPQPRRWTVEEVLA